jgi:hypothetical protein
MKYIEKEKRDWDRASEFLRALSGIKDKSKSVIELLSISV